jgi:Ca2+-binding RTX toxin-like protein
VVIEGSLKGGGTIRGGSQTNIINAHGSGNTIIESGGNDVVSAGTGSATVTTGSGDVVVNLNGKNNTVNGGNGNDTVNMLTSGNSDVRLGTGTDSIVETVGSKGGNTFILTGSNASLTLYGANDVAFIDGGTDTIADHTKGLEVKIGKEGGVIDLSGFAADLTTGFIDLVGGVGGFKTAKAAVAALQSDGNGGTLLSLGASGQIDFVGVPVGALKVANFHIG